MDQRREQALFRQIQQGDTSAADEVLAEWNGQFVGFLAKMTPFPEAQDIAQESYIVMIQKFHRFSNLEHAKRFLYKVGYRKAIDFIRRAGKKRAVIEALSYTEPPAQAIDSTDDLYYAVNQLPPKEKAVVMLRLQQDLSHREIAARLGIPIGTVLYRMHRAVRALRIVLEPELRREL